MAKYAVFVDDGFNKAFDTRDEAKSYAAEMRAEIKAMGRHDSCYFKKMTREQEKMLDGTTESKKRSLVDELLQYGPEYLKARSISIVNSSRNKHQKIPYAEIGEALHYAAANMTNEQLGKLFING